MKSSLKMFLLFVVVGMGLARCSSMTSTSPSAAGEIKTLTLIGLSNREGTLEPCGCEVTSTGGVDREYNLLKSWNAFEKQALITSAGSTFIPAKYDEYQKNVKVFQEKAKFVAQALQALHTRFISPSLSDLALGVGTMQAMETSYQFNFLSANLFSANGNSAYFRGHEVLSGYTIPVVIVGLASEENGEFILPESRVENPATALKRELSQLPSSTPHFIIVLGNLTETERKEILKTSPEVNVIFGGQPYEPTFKVKQLQNHTLFSNPKDRESAAVKFEFELQPAFTSFYNEHVAREGQERVAYFEERAKETEAEWKKTRQKQKREQLKKSLDELKADVEEQKRTQRTPEANSIYYTFVQTYLEKNFDQPNELTKIVSHYKNRLRELAVEEP